MSNLPAPSLSWSDVARVCRRVCVLRERGQLREAEQIRSSLPELLIAVRAPTDTDTSVANRLEKLFSEEAERVANAAVVAELLAPMLSEQIRLPTALPPPPVPSALPLAPAPKPSRPPAVRATSIADFIDEMIAQESPPERAGSVARKT